MEPTNKDTAQRTDAQINKKRRILKKLRFPLLVISVFTILKVTHVVSVTWFLLLVPLGEMLFAYFVIFLGGKALLKKIKSKRQ